MLAKTVLVASAVVLLFGLPTPASADFSVTFPDGSFAEEMDLGFGIHFTEFVSADSLDIFAYTADSFSNLVFEQFTGFPPALVYWLQFQGFNNFGSKVYDVFVSQGSGFFFVETVVF